MPNGKIALWIIATTMFGLLFIIGGWLRRSFKTRRDQRLRIERARGSLKDVIVEIAIRGDADLTETLRSAVCNAFNFRGATVMHHEPAPANTKNGKHDARPAPQSLLAAHLRFCGVIIRRKIGTGSQELAFHFFIVSSGNVSFGSFPMAAPTEPLLHSITSFADTAVSSLDAIDSVWKHLEPR